MNKKMKNRKLTWRPDKPDSRDFKYRSLPEVSRLHIESVPTSIDLRWKLSPVVDQGDIGSCTANAASGGMEYLQKIEIRNKLPEAQCNQVFTYGQFDPISRLFIYYNERVIDGTVSEDAGSTLRTSVKALSNSGICRENICAYDTKLMFNKPSDAAYPEGLTHTKMAGYALNSVTDMKKCLSNFYPFVFGMMVYDSFMSQKVATTGIVPMPKLEKESIQGGHAILAVGYDDAKQWFIVRNSWGTSWGDQGYFYLPYKYMANPNLCSDFWTLRKIV